MHIQNMYKANYNINIWFSSEDLRMIQHPDSKSGFSITIKKIIITLNFLNNINYSS